jgi:hypothetical protein
MNIIPVTFRGNTLSLIDHNGQPFVAMRPVVDGMGLAWQPQHAKLLSNTNRWAVTGIVMVAEDGKRRPMTCMPLRKLPGWLATISPNRVRSEIRETILAYQAECDNALWEHWSKQHGTQPQIPAGAIGMAGSCWLLSFGADGKPVLKSVPAGSTIVDERALDEITRNFHAAASVSMKMMHVVRDDVGLPPIEGDP